MKFSTRLLIQHIVVILLVILLATGIYGWLTYNQLLDEVGSKTLAVAQSLAEDQDLTKYLATDSPDISPAILSSGPVQRQAEVVRQRVKALFVVVADRNGIRWSHPDPNKLGLKVSTDPVALNGEEVTVQETGTLGPSVRSKVPIYSPERVIIGEISVGYSTEQVFTALGEAVGPILTIAGIAITSGAIGAVVLLRRLRRVTLGLEPEEIGELVKDQEAVLYGVNEGVIGVSPDGRLTVCNAKAERLLGLAKIQGQPPAAQVLPAQIVDLWQQESDSENRHMLIAGSVLNVTARKVVHADQELGWVIMLRDRTDVQELNQQLAAVDALNKALRVQRHEFANRLHTISGLLELNEAEGAAAYLQRILETGSLRYPLGNANLLKDTFLLAFLGAKSIQAAERGVRLGLAPETALYATLEDPQDVTTIIGNLVDNAITAAVHGSAENRWVWIALLSEGRDLYCTVSDSGDGITAEFRTKIFEEGFGVQKNKSAVTELEIGLSGKDVTMPDDAGRQEGTGRGEGIGLALARQLARIGGGDIQMLDPGQEGGPGAVFVARLCHVLHQQEVKEGSHDG